jgi:hypothetical protein
MLDMSELRVHVHSREQSSWHDNIGMANLWVGRKPHFGWRMSFSVLPRNGASLPSADNLELSANFPVLLSGPRILCTLGQFGRSGKR